MAEVPENDLPEATASSNAVPATDLPQQANEVPEHDLPQDAAPNSTLAATEGAMRGMTGGLSDVVFKGARNLAETYSSDPDFWAPKMEDVANREETTEGKAGEAIGLGAGLLSGEGIPGAISSFSKNVVPEATTVLGKIGSAYLAGMIEMGTIQAGDELSKAMLGHGDPETPVSSALAHIGGAGLIGGITGGFFNAAGQGVEKGLAKLENAKIGDRATKLLAGMGAAAKAHAAGVPEKDAAEFITNYLRSQGAEDINYATYKPGVKLYYSGVKRALDKATSVATDSLIGGAVTKATGSLGAGVAAARISHSYVVPIVEKVLNKPLIGVGNKLVIPTVMNALSKGQTTGLFNALNYATQVSKGARAVNNGIEAIFKAGGQKAFDNTVSDKDRQKIMDYIDNGGANREMQDSLQEQQPQQGFAAGGEVQQHDNGSISTLYPAQAALMNTAKGRMSNYLQSLKPQPNNPKLPFSRELPMKGHDRTYNNAIDIAAQPLSILNRIKDGTLRMEDIKHLNSMYPELVQHLQKQLTKRLMQAQIDDKSIPGKTQQSMSLFLGTPLAGWMQPQMIQAAQLALKPKQTAQQGQQQAKTKKGTSNLGKSNKSYKTSDQAAESDRSSRE